VGIGNTLRVRLGLEILLLVAASKGTWSVERDDGRDIVKCRRTHPLSQLPNARASELKDASEDLAACKVTDTGALQKATEDVSAAVKAIYAGLKTAADGIGEAHEGISGSIEEYESEADDQVNAGIAASMKHPDFGTQKMLKVLQREQDATNRRLEKAVKAFDDRLTALFAGLTNGLTKAAEPRTVAATPTPMRTAITVEKSADGTGAATLIKVNGTAIPDVTTSVSPVMTDGVTPNPEFTKLAEAQGDACQKALRSAAPQVGNPFVGIEELVSKRLSA